MTADFAGKTALITGAGRGIGRAIALGLAGAGARVILLARTAAQLDETRALLRGRGVPAGRISVVPADLSDEQDRGRAAAAVLAAGRVDILVNNAATVEPLGPTIGIAAADLRLAFEVNVVAPAALTAAVLPGMLDAGWGRVVNVSSGIAAYPAGMVRGNAYATTKAALEAHTVNLAAELKRHRRDRQRLPAGRGRHRHAGLDPPPGPRAHRRRPARAVQPELRRGHPDHPGALRRRADRPPGRRRHRGHLGRQHRPGRLTSVGPSTSGTVTRRLHRHLTAMTTRSAGAANAAIGASGPAARRSCRTGRPERFTQIVPIPTALAPTQSNALLLMSRTARPARTAARPRAGTRQATA